MGVANQDATIFSFSKAKVPTGMIVLGGVVLFVSSCGWFVSCRGCFDKDYIGSRLVVYGPAIALILCFFVQIVFLILLIRTDSVEVLRTSWSEAGNDERLYWQNRFHCCGFSQFNVTAGVPCPAGSTLPCVASLDDLYQSRSTSLKTVEFIVGGLLLLNVICSSVAVERLHHLRRELDEHNHYYRAFELVH
eukprot:TRINITY_DN2587_c0_g1_i4.p1 TRINITY_DN2587_c0_g1~~TRINITY_DN2587_c0_g1_i4.p1  ORF type:complete len:191 (+),score=14.85 TRINITY_DN2587_c0_g1_i4:344-916(+)